VSFEKGSMLKKLSAFFLDILEVVVFAIAIFLFLYLLVLQPHKIKGQSMEPNFHDGEFLLTDKVTYRFSQPKRGDVIVFKAPGTNNDEFIKRIIGLPGEKLSINNGKVNINEKTVEEGYLPDTLLTEGGMFLKEGQAVTIPENHFFVLGDNRIASSDSRTWGFITKDEITGRAWVTYWPPPKLGVIESVSYN
jgi:signal peptidase I